MDTPPQVSRRDNIAAGTKRPAPEPLLPAFDFPSSPPKLPPAKRQRQSPPQHEDGRSKYPTPVPTSSLGFDLTSSPPQIPTRTVMSRTMSSVSERAPLSSLPTLTPPANGEAMLLGRSSSSSHYQLGSNRLISRVHVKVMYIPDPFNPRMEIMCCGWNGVKVHCLSHAWELAKGDTFSTTQEGSEILLDVQDSRVSITWPRTGRPLPQNVHRSPIRNKVGVVWAENDENADPDSQRSRERFSVPPSPLPRLSASGSFGRGVPPSPASSRSGNSMTSEFNMNTDIQIYEDRSDSVERDISDEEPKNTDDSLEGDDTAELPALPSRAPSPSPTEADGDEQSSELDVLSSSLFQDDEDEENDQENSQQQPAFSFRASSSALPALGFTRGHKRRHSSISSIKLAPVGPSEAEIEAIKNHATNQLAFSRLSSTPLSTILANLPPTITAQPLTCETLSDILSSIDWIGIVKRQGKDAAGKPLESQYYYIPDKDTDDSRRGAVTEGLRKPGLRACRRVHKQYFWRKPKA